MQELLGLNLSLEIRAFMSFPKIPLNIIAISFVFFQVEFLYWYKLTVAAFE